MRRCMECLDFSSDPFAFLFFFVICTPVVILLRPTEKDYVKIMLLATGLRIFRPYRLIRGD